MPRVGFEPRIPVFERAKTVPALDRAATVTGTQSVYRFWNIFEDQSSSDADVDHYVIIEKC
jgi:hypothetical protein